MALEVEPSDAGQRARTVRVLAIDQGTTSTRALVYDTCQEMYFQYAKIQPYLAEFRQKMNLPEWMINIERLVEGSSPGRERIATMRKNLAAIAEDGADGG